MSYIESRTAHILYKNWEGVTRWRRILPLNVLFASTDWHKEPQWLLQATDLDKQAERSFALKDVIQWRTTPPEAAAAVPAQGEADGEGSEI